MASPVEHLLPFRRRGPDQHGTHARGDYPATGKAHPERHRADQPDGDDPGQKLRRLYAGRGGTDGKGQGRGGRRGWWNIADAIRGVRNCVGRPQQAPRDERSGHHSCECRAGQQVPGVRARNALHRLACAGVQGSDCRALPEEVDEGPAEAFYPGLGGEDLDCVHRDRPFCFTKVSSIPRISANSSGEAGCADSAPRSRLPAEPLNARFSRSPAICCCVCSLGTPAS